MRGLWIIVVVACLWVANSIAQPPLYKPSSRSSTPLDISSNSYGASTLAPAAIGIGETAPNFSLPMVGGGTFQLNQAKKNGPVVVIFYRGHW